MSKRGSWGPMADRVRNSANQASPAVALPVDLKHCWVTDQNGRLPALLLAWRRVADEFEGRVVRLVWEDEGWTVVAEWLPATMLEKA